MKKPHNIHFEISERKILLRIMDVAFILTSLYVTNTLFQFDYFKVSFGKIIYSVVLTAYFLIMGSIFELYDLKKSSQLDVTTKNVILTGLVTVALYLLTPVYSPALPASRIQILFFFLAMTFGLIVWRYLYIIFFATSRFNKRILLVANSTDMEFIIEGLEKTDPNYRIVAVLNTGESSVILSDEIKTFCIETVEEGVDDLKISEIIVASRTGKGITPELSKKLMHILGNGTPVRSFINAYEELTQRIPVRQVERDFYNYFPFSRNNHNKLYLFINRIFDVLLSVVGILIGIILLPFIFIGNLIANRGPLFYTQDRVGKNGKVFKVFKFRSMVKNAEKNGAQFSHKGDSRITKFGRFLRRTRIDEVPQFLNVIKGDMSLIGPRPERPEFVCLLNEKIPFYEVRHVIKPGITGWAQVKAKYGENEEDSLEKLQYDLYYIKHRSLFLDITIVIKTLSTILFFRGQ